MVNTSSMDGGIAPVPYASVYASCKAAICLLHRGAGPPVRGGGNRAASRRLLSLGRSARHGPLEAQRNRPDALARVKPRPPAPGTTFEEFKAQLEAAGRPVEVMDLLELGRFCLQGVKRGDFVIGMGLEESAAMLHRPRRRHRRGWTAAAGRDVELMTRPRPSAPARYTVISADGHAGGDIGDYRPYLARRWHDEFDAWAAELREPLRRSLAPTAYRSWDCDRRLAENESDGIAAEVLFPNTVPPFFEEGNLVALPPTPEDYERRWAGVQAHNRWLADFCARTPGRRAGSSRCSPTTSSDAVAEVRWAADDLPAVRRHPAPVHPTRLAASLPSGRTTTSRCGGLCDELGRPHQHPRGRRRCPTTGSTRWRGPSC